MNLPIGQKPRTTSGKTVENYDTGESHYKRNIFFAVVIMAGIATIGFVSIGGLETLQDDLTDLAFTIRGTPAIIINPPGNESREIMRDELIRAGVNEDDIGTIRGLEGERTDGNVHGNESFVFNRNDLPKRIPLSEYIVINNLEILEGDKVRYEVENTASIEKDMPFVELQIFLNLIKPSGEPYRVHFYRATSIEIGEERMAPGEKRIFVSEEPWERLKNGGYEKAGISYNGIDSLWFEINEF